MLKTIYYCDICNEIIEPGHGFGLRFIGNHDFVLDNIQSTGNKHICDTCLNGFSEIITQRESGD